MGKFPIGEKNKKKCKIPKTAQEMKTFETNNKKWKNQEKMLKQQMKIKRLPTKWKWKCMSHLFFLNSKLEEPQMSECKKESPTNKNEKIWKN